MDTNLELKALKKLIKNSGAHALLLRSTDSYFNEYVPEYLSPRAFITKFNGSVGDALITIDDAHLFVDGRYELQAQKQALDFTTQITQNNLSIESSWLNFLNENLKSGQTLLYDPATLDLTLYEKLSLICDRLGIKLEPNAALLISQIFKPAELSHKEPCKIWSVPLEITGISTQEKIQQIGVFLKEQKLDCFLVVKLDDIAWLLNMRGNAFVFQRTFPALACVMRDKIILGLKSGIELAPELKNSHLEVVEESVLIQKLSPKKSALIIGIDENETSKAHELALRAQDIAIKRVINPIALLKAIKNEQELLHMRGAFKKADHVIYKAQNLIEQSYEEGKSLSEGEIDDLIKKLFAESHAPELSFRPICASGKNGAIIHYGTPDREKRIEPGSLFLLDTGAYYQGGYATDLTRTFLVGKKSTHAEKWQKEMFTLVLKSSIKGLSARFRRGLLGQQLDAMVRAPLWQAGLDYAHGTGHGVGINVHEFPPRIGPTSTSPLREGQVFSIEPGLYFNNLGGVRIENLVCVVADPEHEKFLRILPLTFSPLDQRLIETSMLDNYEEKFLKYYRDQWHNLSPMPDLPPMPEFSWL